MLTSRPTATPSPPDCSPSDHIPHPDPEAAVRQYFATVFSACVVPRTAHGPDFATEPVDHDAFTTYLALSVTRTLLADS
ncbi:hypothetical protein ACFWZK_13945 [[Kitasatospora] papulosa]|uniref:hypothetical protein n=1 Tax=Streptomyces TaxID=1883 RepID=UPI000402F8C1|nr:hypothetical protein [Streptomyces sp. SID9727]